MQNKPYYAVIFTSKKSTAELAYDEMSNQMLELSKKQNGFIGIESVRGVDGVGITISYWQTLEDIAAWKNNSQHLVAQKLGQTKWYEYYKVKICKVEREYSME
jgi:heme-degrading monooxygenase HmoA